MNRPELPSETHEHVRLVDLRRLHLDEIQGAPAEALRRSVQGCERCSGRLADLEQEATAFIDEARVGPESAAILARLEAAEATPRRAWWRAPWISAAAVAAAALLAVVAVGPQLTSSPPTTRIKGGGVGLVMFVKGAEGVHRAEDGVRLGQGDQIQFRYDADGHRHLFVVSVDGRGVVSPLYPEDPTQSIAVQPDGTHVLDGSVILDDAVGPERFFAVFSAEPLPFAQVAEAAQRGLQDVGDITNLPALPLGRNDVTQASILIVKE